MGRLSNFFSRFQRSPPGFRLVDPPPPAPPLPALPASEDANLPAVHAPNAPAVASTGASYPYYDGESYPGGLRDEYGAYNYPVPDLEKLRARSNVIFTTNHYGVGLINRLVTNTVHAGLHLEAHPVASLVDVPQDELEDWAETVEERFTAWASTKKVCDAKGRRKFGGMQSTAYREALVDGDAVIVLRQKAETKLPSVEIIPGRDVVSGGVGNLPEGHVVRHGVELNAEGEHVAYYVRRRTSTDFAHETVRIAVEDATGRRQAFMFYGSEVRANDVRGMPMLGLIAQSLKELDKYRASAQRKALINSLFAMFVQRSQQSSGSNPVTNLAARRGRVQVSDNGPIESRSFQVAEMFPGMVVEELDVGEELKGFKPDGTDLSFADFERTVLASVAWCFGVPPEILMLSFNSNYSASQAALNEFNILLSFLRASFSEGCLQPIYEDWLISAVAAGRVKAEGLQLAATDLSRFEVFYAWTSADWTGAIKPTTDPVKATKAFVLQIQNGLSTRDMATKGLHGRKFTSVARQLKRENENMREVIEALGATVPSDDGADTVPEPDEPEEPEENENS